MVDSRFYKTTVTLLEQDADKNFSVFLEHLICWAHPATFEIRRKKYVDKVLF